MKTVKRLFATLMLAALIMANIAPASFAAEGDAVISVEMPEAEEPEVKEPDPEQTEEGILPAETVREAQEGDQKEKNEEIPAQDEKEQNEPETKPEAEDKKETANEELAQASLLAQCNGRMFTVSGKLPGGVSVSVNTIATEAAEDLIGEISVTVDEAYDIKLVLDGAEYQPEEGVTISLENAELEEGEDYSVYHIHDGSVEELSANTDGDTISFMTDSFSTFVIGHITYDTDNAVETYAAGDNIRAYLYYINGSNDSDGYNLVLNGTGPMYDWPMGQYNQNDCPWYSKRSKIKEIHISDGITTFGENAFRGNQADTIHIPESVTRIERSALDEAAYSSLTGMEGVEYIGKWAIGSSNLTTIHIPDSVKMIDNYGVSAEHLQSITGMQGITTWGTGAVAYNLELTSIEVPPLLEELPEEAFAYLESIESITIPGRFTSLPKDCFKHCLNLRNVTLEEGLETIGQYAFQECTSLESIYIPSTVTTLVQNAFAKCSSLTRIDGGSGVESISWPYMFVVSAQTPLTFGPEASEAFRAYDYSMLDNRFPVTFELPTYTVYYKDSNTGYIVGSEEVYEGERPVNPPAPDPKPNQVFGGFMDQYTRERYESVSRLPFIFSDKVYVMLYESNRVRVTVDTDPGVRSSLNRYIYIERESTQPGFWDGFYLTEDDSNNGTNRYTMASGMFGNFTPAEIPEGYTFYGYYTQEGVNNVGDVCVIDAQGRLIPSQFVDQANFPDDGFIHAAYLLDTPFYDHNGDLIATVHPRNDKKWTLPDGEEMPEFEHSYTVTTDTDEKLYTFAYYKYTPSVTPDEPVNLFYIDTIYPTVPGRVDLIYELAEERKIVTFKDDYGDVIDRVSVHIGTKFFDFPRMDYREHYRFVGWRNSYDGQIYTNAYNTPEVTEAVTYTAVYEPREYTIHFINYNADHLLDIDVPYGEWVEYTGETPQKPDDTLNVYRFDGWEPSLGMCLGEKTYQAKFKTVPKPTCTVTFKEATGAVIRRLEVVTGLKLTYLPEAEVKENYNFTGWKSSYDGAVYTALDDMPAVTANVTYTATYSPKDYEITFLDYDGTELLKLTVPYCGEVVYTGRTPVRAEDDDYTYRFTGDWNSSLNNFWKWCTGEAIYTPVFEPVEKPMYTIVFTDEKSSMLQGGETYARITINIREGKELDTIPFIDNEWFVGWTDSAGTLHTADDPAIRTAKTETYTATYDEPPIYTITFKNTDGTVIQTGEYVQGSTVTPPSFTAIRFIGWTAESTGRTYASEAEFTASGDEVYIAAYAPVPKYTITFKNYNGDILQTGVYTENDPVEYTGDIPVRPEETIYTYAFDGWSPAPEPRATKDAIYIATFKAIEKTKPTYRIIFKDSDGKTISSASYKEGALIQVPTVNDYETDGYKHTFKGWNPEIEHRAWKDMTYTARYEVTQIIKITPTPTPIITPTPVITPVPKPTPTPKPKPRPTVTPKPTPTSTPTPVITPRPTQKPTPIPTAKPTPKPTVAPKKETPKPTPTPAPKPKTSWFATDAAKKVIKYVSVGVLSMGIIASAIFTNWWLLLFNLLFIRKRKVWHGILSDEDNRFIEVSGADFGSDYRLVQEIIDDEQESGKTYPEIIDTIREQKEITKLPYNTRMILSVISADQTSSTGIIKADEERAYSHFDEYAGSGAIGRIEIQNKKAKIDIQLKFDL